LPYTGSDPLTLAVTLDKDCAKRLVASCGVKVPADVVLPPEEVTIEVGSVHPSLFPVIVKPAWEGSSKGIRNRCFVDKPHKLQAVAEEMSTAYRQPILIEEFIEGDELTVGIIGNNRPKVLGIMRVLPTRPTEHFVYSLEVKR